MPRCGPLAVCGACLIAAFGIPVFGGQQQTLSPFTIRDNVELVVLDVSVKKTGGGYASGLKKQNFTVYDDGHVEPLTHFSPADAPATVGLIVDNSGSMNRKRPEIVTAGISFARSSNPKDEFFVVNFNDHVYAALPPSQPFTDQIQMLRAALYFGTPVGRTALYDAIEMGLQQLSKGHLESKTLIVVSDGGDNASKIALPQLLRLITASRATIYAIGLMDPEDHDLNPGVLRKISSISGGEFFEPKRLEDVWPVFQRISDDIRHRYTIGFTPPVSGDSREVHHLKVQIHDSSGTKYTVHTRVSYLTRTSAEP